MFYVKTCERCGSMLMDGKRCDNCGTTIEEPVGSKPDNGWAITLMTIGGIFAFYAIFLLDVSVPTEHGGRVVNLGLVADRFLWLLFAGLLAIIGAILYRRSKRQG